MSDLVEQRRESSLDLVPNTRGASGAIHLHALEGQDRSAPLANAELQLGAADLDAEYPG